jgi:hypothetical protein
MDRIKDNASNNSSVVACILIAAGTCLPTSCLATMGQGINIQTHRHQGDFISLLLVLENKESRLKITRKYEIICQKYSSSKQSSF